MAIKTPAYFKWRDGRPRWEPGPGVRRKGFRGRDLKDERGAWLDLGAAIAAAAALNEEVSAWTAAGGEGRRRPPPAKPSRTFRALHDKWTLTPEYRMLAAKTRSDYANKANVFLAEFGDEPVAALKRTHLKAWWRELYDARGHAMANGVLAVVRALLTFAADEDWIAVNPALQLGLPTVPPRVVVFSPSEAAALVATADRMGLHETADAIVVALHTGQRQGDVLALETVKTEKGRTVFRQSKTGAIVSVPQTPALAARLATIRERRAGLAGVIELGLARRVVLRADGSAYPADQLRKDFRAVREAVAKEHPAIADKQFMDLRDTAVTRLALADCNMQEIRSITGHSLETVHQVMRHYMALDDRMADSAIAKLRTWMEQEGIAV